MHEHKTKQEDKEEHALKASTNSKGTGRGKWKGKLLEIRENNNNYAEHNSKFDKSKLNAIAVTGMAIIVQNVG